MMDRSVTIVMYHYVRDLEHSRYPGSKGLTIDKFRRQLDHIQAHYTPITLEALQAATESREHRLPSNPVLLTFDDGYTDHFVNVFPMLDERGIQGCFFPPAQAIAENVILDVNKIHFILACGSDPKKLLDRILELIPQLNHDYAVQSKEFYVRKLGGGHRYDNPETTTVKILLQRELPEPIRRELVRLLFAEYVTSDEAAFARELYMSMDQIACLRRHGMHVGSHGYAHAWLDHLSPEAQAVEVDRSLEFLRDLGVASNDWTMCYPYGGFNDSLLKILRGRSCSLGFAVGSRVANLDTDDRLALPRLDTNDLPS
jgi:peptidoglycan/xylan/chitin deacetylase (PgdA/CDA1 family)